jgi:hypothetical protein
MLEAMPTSVSVCSALGLIVQLPNQLPQFGKIPLAEPPTLAEVRDQRRNPTAK